MRLTRQSPYRATILVAAAAITPVAAEYYKMTSEIAPSVASLEFLETSIGLLRLDGDNLVFDIDVLEGDSYGFGGLAAVFIDIMGRPITPVSYAGVARRTTRRAAMYTGAAVESGNDAPSTELCGYAPYPPCGQ